MLEFDEVPSKRATHNAQPDDELLDAYSRAVTSAAAAITPSVVNIDVHDSRGRRGGVSGVNTAVIMGAQGICFAIGVNTAIFVAARLMRDGRVARSSIGVAGQSVPLHRRVIRFYDLPLEHGVLVAGVEEGSPAARAGLAEGDLIVAFGGKAVASVDELHRLLTEERVGANISVDVIRMTEKLALEVTPERAR